MPEKYLLDASAVYPLVLKLGEKILQHKDLFAILDLTVYEIGNAIWKEYRRGRVVDPSPVAEAFKEILKDLKKLSVGDEFQEILNTAIESNITFYDASYIHVARKHKLKLITEDKDLIRFPESITVDGLLEELKLAYGTGV